MLKIMNAEDYLTHLKKRNLVVYLEKQDAVEKIIQEVLDKGDEALYQYAKDLDGVQVDDFNLTVSQEEYDKANKDLHSDIKAVIQEAYDNIMVYHLKEKEEAWNFTHNGAFLGQLVNPIEKVGVYVPGGKGIYPSTVLMNCVPAKIAGVPEIYISTPPRKDGTLDPAILFAAQLCGVKSIYKVGGAGAIAAMAYGTASIPKVYKITGPGNLYVTTAKKRVYGDVDIDMIAGPSEIMVLADETTNINALTYDLFSQSEHSTDASSIILVPNRDIANAIIESVNEKVLQSKRQAILREALSNNGVIVLYNSLEKAYEVINDYAPEHLEVLIDLDYTEVSQNIKNVGSIFLGEYTPEPIGDYFAGTNHSLPTGGTAKFFSPLGVYDFQKRTSVLKFSKKRFMKDREKVIRFAEYEGFYEHANSVRAREDL